jgi:hypothetical protein
MNKKIEELLYSRFGYGTKALMQPADIEMFAELIIDECVGACTAVANMATITNSGEIARKTAATANSCGMLIKEKFGVE